MSEESKPRVEIIHRPNTLREKVGGSADGKPGRIDPVALSRASLHVSRLAEAHKTQTRIDLTELQAAFQAAMAAPDQRAAHLRRVFKISDGILTLGKTFGYDLLSDVANALNHLLIDLEAPTAAQLQVVALHIDAMQLIVRDDMKGDGGNTGQALAQSLALAREKVGGRR
ncbi:hypothetical protein [Oleisolibacter albus]|uniref:hypothetical protein n=1 Tax=Oleisolibacter albus TaxID=2171757 RepID=UPI000DF458AD|nr:hypothetical protein [Oleisolibacter albus]